ncbi:MAG: amidase, partial [Rhodospirillales bacterium]
MDICRLSTEAALARMATGDLTARELVQACLDRIALREDAVGAWTFLDPGLALAQADAADQRRRDGSAGPLNGIPVGIKDIIDTADQPTENGSRLCAGRRPDRDATLVALLREAGAVIMGKCVTTEFALSAPGKTRNPHDPERTPGGSSSGSAAAVADFMVPLAIGSQTGGSMLRPASFNGVYGLKPTFGTISRAG